jgi:hypothetical protein
MAAQIACQHCGQTYNISPEQMPQYQGKAIACTKCGKQFAVAAPPMQSAPTSVPPPLPPSAPMAAYAPPIYAYPPQPKAGLGGGAIAAIVLGILAVLAIPCLIATLLPALNKVRGEAQKAKCASNLKNIAAACIQYSNMNAGAYPDSTNTLLSKTGMSNQILVCPASNDVPGQCSYVYLGGTLTSYSPPNTVLAYEPLTNHHNMGMHVLFNDYSVQWLKASDAQKLINSIVPGQPVVWTPPSATSGN